MKLRFVLLPLLLTLLIGCSLPEDPRQNEQASIREELSTLRQESSQLQARQKANDARMQEIQRMIDEEQSKQRRFREMMTTNFDLLEKSVAVMAEKKQPPGQPGNGPVAEKTSEKRTAAAEQNGGKEVKKAAHKAEQGAMKDRKNLQSPAPVKKIVPVRQPANNPGTQNIPLVGLKPMELPAEKTAAAEQPARQTAITKASPPIAEKAPAILALNGEGLEQPGSRLAAANVLDDPDLKGPANPRVLKPHPEAKPLYEKGFTLFAKKKYDQSVIIFENFLKRFPNDLYSDNAQFWVGEAHLRLNNTLEAEAAYRKVLRNYAHKSTLEGYKTPDAIYRLAQTYQKREDDRLARYYYQAVSQNFPDTSAGRKATRELESMVASISR